MLQVYVAVLGLFQTSDAVFLLLSEQDASLSQGPPRDA